MAKRAREPYFWIREHGGWAAIRAHWLFALIVVIVLGVPTASLLTAPRSRPLLVVESMVMLGAWWLAIRGLFDDPPPGMAPYFDRRIGDIHSYSRGKIIARRCRELDVVAQSAGVPTLSSFGFADDFDGEELVWHSTADGLRTFEALRDHVSRAAPDDVTLLEELDAIIDALEKAKQRSASFCLLITAPFTNAMEHERRKGSFF
jgi:hypothetical protein